MVAIAGFDVPDGVFERCQLWRRKVPTEHWRRRLARAPLAMRLEWAMTAHALEPYLLKAGMEPELSKKRAERLAFRSVEPEPPAPKAKR